MSRIHTPQRSAAFAATALAAVAALICGAPGAAPAVATAPGANGSIVYANEVRGDFELFSVGADGSGARQLTHVNGDAVHPDWSPDGTRIVFELDHTYAKPRPYCSVALMNPDGSGFTDLAAGPRGCDNQPSFSPDGQRIVFVHYDDVKDVERIATMDTSGGSRRDITTPWKNGVTDPNMSPDGTTITFVRSQKERERQALFAMRPNGAKLHRLTPYGWEVAIKHDWSPDGKLIALTTNADFVRPHTSANLVTIRPDGTVARRLTRFRDARRNAFAGSFSPDGRQIVFRLEQGDKAALAVIDRDGRNLRRITPLGSTPPRFIDWGTG